MPKMKTHRGAAKRFQVTGSGKIRRRKGFRAHLLEKKPTKRTRRLAGYVILEGGDKARVERLLGRR
jgi:large subunit ribosomal protein L35